MEELNQIINQVVMNLDHNEKAKLVETINKKEMIEYVIYNLIKDSDKHTHKHTHKIKEIDNQQYILLMNSMHH